MVPKWYFSNDTWYYSANIAQYCAHLEISYPSRLLASGKYMACRKSKRTMRGLLTRSGAVAAHRTHNPGVGGAIPLSATTYPVQVTLEITLRDC